MRFGRLVDRYFIKQPRLRRLVTRLLFGSSVKEIDLLGARLSVHSEFENGYLRAYLRTQTTSLFRDEASAIINLASLLGDDCTFLDVGANVGIYSSIISRLGRFKKNLSVIAFEVDPRTFERLSRNASLHGFKAENVGLGEKENTIDFIRGAVSHVTTTLETRNKYSIGGEIFRARCRPLSAFDIPGSSIILKIDVEGVEYDILLGARKFFEEGRVKAVYFDGVERFDEAVTFLSRYGFQFFDGRTLEPVNAHVFSLLAVRAESMVLARDPAWRCASS